MVMLDHLNANRKDRCMKELTKDEMLNISGGALSGALLTALFKGLNIFTDIGRYFGSAIRRLVDNNLCGY